MEAWKEIFTDEAEKYRACILEFGTKAVLSDTCRQYVEAHIEEFLLQLLNDPHCKRVFGWEEDCDETEHYYLENEKIFFEKLMTKENAELITETMLQILQDGKAKNTLIDGRNALIEIFRRREELHIDVLKKADMDSMTFLHDGLLKFPEIARIVSDMQEGVIEATEKSGDFELRAEVLDFCYNHFKPMTIQERFAL